ncbi:leucine-rich repeat domain-containing protein [Treponema sp.]|uniref:leucine-rich repeat domain-containing protein n=1 Tax=Treponema sp. TaxID=166 RepID=UPI00388D088B
MNFNTYDYIFDIPTGGDIDNGCYFESHWVEIKKCMLDKDSTTEIVIPEGVEVIGEYAFINCVNLKKITFPSSLRKIREGAFECCKSLESISFSNPVRIDADAFRFCESLKSVEINFTNTRKSSELIWENQREPGELPGYLIETHDTGLIWRGAFKDCQSLKEIKLCSQVEYYKNDESLNNVAITGGKSR